MSGMRRLALPEPRQRLDTEQLGHIVVALSPEGAGYYKAQGKPAASFAAGAALGERAIQNVFFSFIFQAPTGRDNRL